jgi:hypothetical protein
MQKQFQTVSSKLVGNCLSTDLKKIATLANFTYLNVLRLLKRKVECWRRLREEEKKTNIEIHHVCIGKLLNKQGGGEMVRKSNREN